MSQKLKFLVLVVAACDSRTGTAESPTCADVGAAEVGVWHEDGGRTERIADGRRVATDGKQVVTPQAISTDPSNHDRRRPPTR